MAILNIFDHLSWILYSQRVYSAKITMWHTCINIVVLRHKDIPLKLLIVIQRLEVFEVLKNLQTNCHYNMRRTYSWCCFCCWKYTCSLSTLTGINRLISNEEQYFLKHKKGTTISKMKLQLRSYKTQDHCYCSGTEL